MKKNIIFIILLAVILLYVREAQAVDILEIRVKRLYQEAQAAADKGDYDGALEAYNKAIGYAKDRDIRQFLMNEKKELQKKRRKMPGPAGIPAPEKAVSGVTPSEMQKKEAVPEKEATSPAEPAKPEKEEVMSDEKARLEEERAKLEAERKKLEGERANLEAEKIRAEQAEREARLEQERKAKEEEEDAAALEKEEKEIVAREKTIIEELSSESESDTADLEQRQEREANDRAAYESSEYRYKVKQILDNAYKKFKETSAKIEQEEMLTRVQSKIDELAALDQQAEEFMAQGQYEKARELYEKILALSKDQDLKEYMKEQNGD